MPVKQVSFFKKKRLIYCSEMYKCLHEYPLKTVPVTSLHETCDTIQAVEVYYVETTITITINAV